MQHLKAATRRIRASWRTPRLRSSWTLTSRVVMGCLIIAIVQNIVYGIFPCCFDFKHRKFVFCKTLAIYCFSVATLIGAFYVTQIWVAYSENKIDLRDPIQIYCYMNLCVALLNYVTQWAIIPEILSFQNSLPLFSTLDSFTISLRSVGRATSLASLKMFVCPLLMHFTLIIYQRHRQPELNWMSTGKLMLPIYLGNQLNNCFFGGIVITKIVLVEINRRLREIRNEVNRLQTPLELLLQKPYYRMQRFCYLADRLDELASKYALSTGRSMTYMLLTAFSLVSSMAINLIITTLGFYTQYQAFADHILLEEAYDIARALAHFVFLVVPFTEICLVARVSQQVLDEAKETGNLLQRINLEHADVRFKQTVDALWLEVITIKYKLMPMGLLELDGSLINKIFSTVAGFLLFLIQNDLTQRFSLK
ncbi:putative gustatory receptor 97a [Drosophila virilis]|uniref:Gustatory receptor n=1 Tax=Drosophila virilis TaxID=7244 RepID=B4M136_DROVI|nr:putative gustatory receptor 97a [Drosophila virilis]EDW67447.1 uncharacterized protein Dvir_GJ24152 [Drosophila virilis]